LRRRRKNRKQQPRAMTLGRTKEKTIPKVGRTEGRGKTAVGRTREEVGRATTVETTRVVAEAGRTNKRMAVESSRRPAKIMALVGSITTVLQQLKVMDQVG